MTISPPRNWAHSDYLLQVNRFPSLDLRTSLVLIYASFSALNRAQKNDKVLAEAEPASTFTLNLRPYQKQALHWMSNLELGVKTGREATMHPLWEE